MKLSLEQVLHLKANSVNLANAKTIADHITNDNTVSGIFQNGDLTKPDIDKFKAKWCPWWPVASVLLNLAKVFTNDKVDKIIDALLKLGNDVCKSDQQ